MFKDKSRNFASKILNQFMFAYIILYVGQTQSLGERVFIGALSGLFFSIFIWLMNKRSAKKEQKEAELVKEQQTKQVQKEIALARIAAALAAIC